MRENGQNHIQHITDGERLNTLYHSIFVVDDDAEDIELFEEALKEIHAVVECNTAPNGTRALEILESLSIPPDVIFLDINMPGMNGLELLGKLKKMHRFKRVPVVILTTSNNIDDVKKARESGASLFMTKPLDFTELCSKVKRILNIDFSQPPPREFIFHVRRKEFF